MRVKKRTKMQISRLWIPAGESLFSAGNMTIVKGGIDLHVFFRHMGFCRLEIMNGVLSSN